MKELVIVMNREVPAGKILNSIGHMMIGVAPRIPKDKLPNIKCYIASTQKVRDFRTKAAYLNSVLTESECIFSDFAHTTTEGSARDHEKQTQEIQEKDINYFSSCICSETDNLSEIYELLNEESYILFPIAQMISEKNHELTNFDFERPIEYPASPDFTDHAKKFSIILKPKLLPSEVIPSLVYSCIEVSRKVERETLRLHNYFDASEISHPGMSEYGLVVLEARSVKRLGELDKEASNPGIDSMGEFKISQGERIALALFGTVTEVNNVTKKNIQLWKRELITSQYRHSQASFILLPGNNTPPQEPSIFSGEKEVPQEMPTNINRN